MKATIVLPALMIAVACGVARVSQASEAGALPVYPGSMPLTEHVPGATKVCGHMLTWKEYRATGNASLGTVATWYQQHLPGSTRLDMAPGEVAHVTVFAAGGAGAAAISALSGDTTIALEHFAPPYSQTEISLMIRAERGDAAARAQAKAQFHCDDE